MKMTGRYVCAAGLGSTPKVGQRTVNPVITSEEYGSMGRPGFIHLLKYSYPSANTEMHVHINVRETFQHLLV